MLCFKWLASKATFTPAGEAATACQLSPIDIDIWIKGQSIGRTQHATHGVSHKGRRN